MNDKYYGKKYIRERINFCDESEHRFHVSAYDSRVEVGGAYTLDEAIVLAKDYFREEIKLYPDLLYNYDKNHDKCINFITISDSVTDEFYNISIEDLTKYIIIKKIVGNIGKIG